MICNNDCDYFVEGERPYCSSSGLAVSEGMTCLEDMDYSENSDVEEDDDKSCQSKIQVCGTQ